MTAITFRPARPRITDAERFVANVVSSEAFSTDGLVFGRDRWLTATRHWVVVDPRRHALFVWQKSGRSILDGARRLGASVATNGPFSDYPHGNFVRSALARSVSARSPLGHVIGRRDAIRETAVSRDRVFYFGRREGSAFDDYAIARGDPPADMVEAVGGLFGCVVNGRPYTVRQHIRVGYWGLLPVKENPALDPDATSAALERVVRSGTELTGLIVFLAGWGSTQSMARSFAAIGVRDGVQIDGGDSLLLARGRRLTIGAAMPPSKRWLQGWGLCFRPVAR